MQSGEVLRRVLKDSGGYWENDPEKSLLLVIRGCAMTCGIKLLFSDEYRQEEITSDLYLANR